jgi:hypothetical protein
MGIFRGDVLARLAIRRADAMQKPRLHDHRGRDAGDWDRSEHSDTQRDRPRSTAALPYPHPEELVAVRHTAPGLNIKDLSSADSCYFIYREQSRTFQDIGLFRNDSVNITGMAGPERVSALAPKTLMTVLYDPEIIRNGRNPSQPQFSNLMLSNYAVRYREPRR